MSLLQHGWIGISSGDLSAEIDPLGAQLSRLTDESNRDLLWNGDPAVWKGRAPLLFPIVGALCGGEYRVGLDRFSLPRHGFAREKHFLVVSASSTEVIFKLCADGSTHSIYPFDFELQVRFAISRQLLSMTATITNLGATDMPASFGYHPAFRWPLPFGGERSSHFIEFDAAEPLPIRRLDAKGLLTPALHPTPIDGRRLKLTDELFDQDVMILDRVASRGVIYGADGGKRLRLEFPDAPYLGIWSKPGAPFICVEPWHGIADPQGFSGDFREKPGVFILGRGEALSSTMSVGLND